MTDTLLDLVDRLPARQRLEEWWNTPANRVDAHGLPLGALPVFAVWLAQRSGRPVLALVPDPEGSFQETLAWFKDGVRTVVFPAVETLPFDRLAPDEETVRRRLEALDALATGGPVVCFSSWNAMTRPTLAAGALRRWSFTLKAGERYSLTDLQHRLTTLGYRREALVQSRGEFSLRGGILDCFPPGRRHPVRAEFFGDDLESLREFDVEGQGSLGSIAEARVLPAAELILTPESVASADHLLEELDFSQALPDVRDQWLTDIERVRSGAYFDGIEGFQAYLDPTQPTLLQHLPADALILSLDPRRSLAQAKQREEELNDLVGVEVERGELPQRLRTGLVSIDSLQAAARSWRLLDIARASDVGAIDLGFEAVDAYAGRIDAFSDRVRTDARAKSRILIVTQQERRLRELLEDRDVYPAGGLFVWPQTPLMPGLVVLGDQAVAQGFRMPSELLDVYGDTDLFGGLRQRVRRGVVRARTATWQLEFEPGDLVVHVDHGIGRFVGMRLMGESGGEREYMQLEYADGDRLFVPVEHLERVQKYVAGGDATPKLQKLGSGEWDRAKRKVRESVEEVAKDLLDLYSRRELVEGHAFSEDGPWQQELEQSFPYDETPDQVRAMQEIKADMEESRPMDRLLCGDVGFGKTELAVRSAFKSVMDGKQVAMLVPTTVLAQQHYLTFQDRFRPFPVKVEMLSRFRTDAEAADILRRLRTAEVDVVIGTHRLLQKDVQFKDLGLVILDEEQRFGVMQKERLKQLRASVDVLSLSATPIPRTLHMSLAGIRDLSVIQTPPEERLPIKTFVTADDDDLIREVIERELQRGGQVFYVYNRVQTIKKAEERVKKLVPHARVVVGHGQMPESTLADVM
ncbi:MAG TPA: DEAD/DEAH box helicase, partial [Candidatus Acidoferrum sp.]|nr:DEAD/DEAH box helicase [Candidatus Acidoferrum sp.]